jgi:hypothetical protein
VKVAVAPGFFFVSVEVCHSFYAFYSNAVHAAFLYALVSVLSRARRSIIESRPLSTGSSQMIPST